MEKFARLTNITIKLVICHTGYISHWSTNRKTTDKRPENIFGVIFTQVSVLKKGIIPDAPH